MEKTVNLKHLATALQDHTNSRISLINEDKFYLNGCKVTITGNLLTSDRISFRFNSIKGLLINLWQEGCLNCGGETLTHVHNRYMHLNIGCK